MHPIRLLSPIFIALIAVAGLAGPPAHAEEQPARIHVRGQAVVAAPPDVAFLTLGASVHRPTAGEAFTRAEELVAALTASLRANGVAERDIQTRQFSLSPEYGRSVGDRPPPIVGWRAIHTLTAKLRDFARIGTTIDQAVGALGDEALVQGIQFAIEDTNALAARARAEAVADARRKAEDLATRAGVRLGRLLLLQEVSSPPPTPTREAALARSVTALPPAAGQGASVDISPGELRITVEIEAIFAIE